MLPFCDLLQPMEVTEQASNDEKGKWVKLFLNRHGMRMVLSNRTSQRILQPIKTKWQDKQFFIEINMLGILNKPEFLRHTEYVSRLPTIRGRKQDNCQFSLWWWNIFGPVLSGSTETEESPFQYYV